MKSARFARLREDFLDLTVEREATHIGLGEDLPAVRDYVKLAALTRFDLDVFREAGFE